MLKSFPRLSKKGVAQIISKAEYGQVSLHEIQIWLSFKSNLFVHSPSLLHGPGRMDHYCPMLPVPGLPNTFEGKHLS
jgi:hypothetical protein